MYFKKKLLEIISTKYLKHFFPKIFVNASKKVFNFLKGKSTDLSDTQVMLLVVYHLLISISPEAIICIQRPIACYCSRSIRCFHE